MKKNTTKKLLILLGLGIGGYIIYKYLYGNKIPWIDINGGGSGVWDDNPNIPPTPTPDLTPLPTPTPTKKTTPFRVTTKDPSTGWYTITSSPTAPLTNKRLLQGLGEISADQGFLKQTTPVLRTTDIIKHLIDVKQGNVTMPSQALSPIVKPVIQPLPLKAFGVNVTAQPSITLPQKFIGEKSVVIPTGTVIKTPVPVIAGTTKKATVVAVGTARTTTVGSTPVPRVTDILKGLIR